MASEASRPRRKIPRGTFWLGGFVGIALGLPLLSLTVLALARHLGVPDAEASIDRVAALAGIFAGLPALLSSGGVARVVAHRMAEIGPDASVRVGVKAGIWTMAVAGMGLIVLVALPEGALPEQRSHWIPLIIAGCVDGALTGAAIGFLTGMRQRRHATAEANPVSLAAIPPVEVIDSAFPDVEPIVPIAKKAAP